MFNIPYISNHSERFTFLGEELDVVKAGLWDVQLLIDKLREEIEEAGKPKPVEETEEKKIVKHLLIKKVLEIKQK